MSEDVRARERAGWAEVARRCARRVESYASALASAGAIDVDTTSFGDRELVGDLDAVAPARRADDATRPLRPYSAATRSRRIATLERVGLVVDDQRVHAMLPQNVETARSTSSCSKTKRPLRGDHPTGREPLARAEAQYAVDQARDAPPPPPPLE